MALKSLLCRVGVNNTAFPIDPFFSTRSVIRGKKAKLFNPYQKYLQIIKIKKLLFLYTSLTFNSNTKIIYSIRLRMIKNKFYFCKLCLDEKIAMIFFIEQNKFLNKRSEIISRRESKFLRHYLQSVERRNYKPITLFLTLNHKNKENIQN